MLCCLDQTSGVPITASTPWSKICPVERLVDGVTQIRRWSVFSGFLQKALCKMTHDTSVIPIATVGRTGKEKMSVLQGKLVQANEMKAQVCLPCYVWGVLVHSLVSHQNFPLGTTTEKMRCEPSVLQQGVSDARGVCLLCQCIVCV